MKKSLPSPFSIAIILTIIVVIIALLYTDNNLIQITSFWEKGLWNAGLINFAMQMMLMLVLGYVIALSSSMNKLINKIIIFCNTTSKAAFSSILFFVIANALCCHTKFSLCLGNFLAQTLMWFRHGDGDPPYFCCLAFLCEEKINTILIMEE